MTSNILQIILFVPINKYRLIINYFILITVSLIRIVEYNINNISGVQYIKYPFPDENLYLTTRI